MNQIERVCLCPGKCVIIKPEMEGTKRLSEKTGRIRRLIEDAREGL
jgi:hypothetical protein